MKPMIFKILFVLALQFLSCGKSAEKIEDLSEVSRDYSTFHKEALAFCKEKKFSEDYYFLIDLSVHSGRNRFFVYDFLEKKNAIQKLVTHGTCDVKEPNPDKVEKVKFSNADNSHCSAKGKYKVGKRDVSSWGIKIKYWLHGLEESNSNAVNRVVVLHSWNAVSDYEIFPDYSPLSWGCPAVSNEFMERLDEKLQKTKKPVLLWIIE